MPFQINLDSSILETSSQFPYILGNIMVNDYLRGLDPLKDNRTPEEEFLSRFGDQRSSAERQALTRHRFITQISANEKGYGNDPRGPGLAYSRWLSKWYIGMGRTKQIFACLMDHIGLMKDLLIQDNVPHTEVFTQKYEEAIIRSFCRIVMADRMLAGDEAVEWYRAARPHNKVHCLELCFGEKIFPAWDAPPLGWKDPGVEDGPSGATVPIRQSDRFADQQNDFLLACFGRDSGGNREELEKQPVGKLIQRILEQAIGKCISVGLANQSTFNLKRTYISELSAEEMYSPMVVIGSYIHLADVQLTQVQPSMAALEGIALCHPTQDLTTHGLEKFSDIQHLRDNIVESEHTGPWASERRRLIGIRTYLWRCLKASGFTTKPSPMSFAKTYEATNHFAVEQQIMYPAECLRTLHLFAFWPHSNPKEDRGGVPKQCLEVLNAMNAELVDWKNKIRGFQSISAPKTEKNSNAPAPIRPEAVRPTTINIEAEEVAERISEVTGRGVKRLREADIFGERSEPTLRQHPPSLYRQSVELKRVKFNTQPMCDEKEEEPKTETQTQVYMWGFLILLILGIFTFRKQF